ncbi:hypothetical protein, partial [Limnobacter sp.]|uniref:hypothetical protein n=1 Tax=Limnobacter sp. TaxID=2003368 RepID=UPI00262C156C
VARGSWLVARGSWLVARGSWLVARGSWLVARGSWLVARGSWASLNHQPFLRRKFAASRGVRLLHHLADSRQGFPADSQRGAIAQAIDASTL